MTVDPLAAQCATAVFERFRGFQERFHEITRRAPGRFLGRQWPQVRNDTTERLKLYTTMVDGAEADIRQHLQAQLQNTPLWAAIKRHYGVCITGREDQKIAETFFNSITRRVFGTVGVDPRIEFVHDDEPPLTPSPTNSIYTVYPLTPDLDSTIWKIFGDRRININQATLRKLLPQITAEILRKLADMDDRSSVHIEMLDNIFYRGQGAYLIGRLVTGRLVPGQRVVPLVMALLHPPGGVVVDALLMDSDRASIVFSYTRSAFHVLVPKPRPLIGFLKSILPDKPEAEIYSAIGYFKHGKTVLYQDICRHTAQCTLERFEIAPGKRGMVMLVFGMDGLGLVIKLIRDRFDNPKKATRRQVMAQYDFVFNHYRAGRLIEAHTFEHLSFDRCWFSDDLIEALLDQTGRTVRVEGERVIIDHAYLERKVIPLDIYLREAPPQKARAAVVDFGITIKDLAFANIFPGDMLLKNFGVTRMGRVVFYDYDEILPLTDCRFRKIPQARTYMEEMADEPWYTVAENDVFPEEFSRFLGLTPDYRDIFMRHHADLMETEFWVNAQKEIRSGYIRHIFPYHPRYRLDWEM